MGWPVHAVEGFEALGWTQHVEHFRPQAALPDLRSPERCDRVGGAFDPFPHTVDVRPLSTAEGWPNIRKIALFTWRLRADPLVWVTARPSAACPFGWTFSPLGQPAPLFTPQRREADDSATATELQVPQPVRRTLFASDLRSYAAAPTPPPRPQFTQMYGEFSAVGVSGLPLAPG